MTVKSKWTAQSVREAFFDFFRSKEHTIVNSAPMVVKDDPTLMFTNAGMNQFKDVFLGNRKAPAPRVADTQKCLRVSGKHNDLEEVGTDTYHHTMFEMLGNWSFGDYFKNEAIEFAWELLTTVYGIDKNRLYATYFSGDDEDGLSEDAEARSKWLEYLPQERVLPFARKDNFWEMGQIGPCGPCSEIHIDIRSDDERASWDGAALVNTGHPRVIELWNLVFIEFNRRADAGLNPLPSKHVDTGMGFERLVMVLQGKDSNYDSDVFSPLIYEIEKSSGVAYGKEDASDVAIRVIADHLRAVTFSIADGQIPGNTGASYVIRRILRRAVRYGYSFLGYDEPFLFAMVALLANLFQDVFPEIGQQQEMIMKVIREEEVNFLNTLEKGIQRFNNYLKKKPESVSGDFAFELYDTYGFPVDLTALMAKENGLTMDEEAFRKRLEVQKSTSRGASRIKAGEWIVLHEDDREEFIGYDRTETEVIITRYREIQIKGEKKYQLVFNLTPFYAESGGQLGDTGYIESASKRVEILDTVKEHDLILHIVNELPEHMELQFRAFVDTARRRKIMGNHSATHLLHTTLRKVLGDHVQQKGSLVAPDRLRFDFSHFKKMTAEELFAVEEQVNALIMENIQLEENRNMPMDEAKKMGAMALFGEKYGDVVRVIRFGDSVELCGGTHVKYTGRIGWFKIISETAIAAGIRRIEALTGDAAVIWINDKLTELDAVYEGLKKPKSAVDAIKAMQHNISALQKKLEAVSRNRAMNMKDQLLGETEDINGLRFIGKVVDLDSKVVKDLMFEIKNAGDDYVAVLGYKNGTKAGLAVAVSDALVASRNLNAGTIVREAAKLISGGGGGQPFFATAGGKDPSGLEQAIEKAKSLLS